MEREITEIFIHCSATRPEWMAGLPISRKVAEIRRWHTSPPRDWSDIGYHWIIDRDGSLAPGRDEATVGAHVKGHNGHSIGVCLIGGFGSDATDDPEEHFTPAQLNALAHLLREMQGRYPLARVRGHNEVAAKACPGFYVPRWLDGLGPPAPEPEEPRGWLAAVLDFLSSLIRKEFPK